MNSPNTSLIIRGIGSYTPSRILTNDEISQFVDTSDEWIRTRSGISERRIAAENESCSDMAVNAAREAIKMANLSPEDIDFLIVATMTPDTITPSTACLVQNKLGLRQIPSFDVGAACTGFIYILGIGSDMLQANSYRNALLIGAEKPINLRSIWGWRRSCSTQPFR
jgi:3-oxoacyl-[acyl-carrier-protein] synthase-3